MTNTGRGWHHDRARHGLASRGIKSTIPKPRTYVPPSLPDVYYAVVPKDFPNDDPGAVYSDEYDAFQNAQKSIGFERSVKKITGPRVLSVVESERDGEGYARVVANSDQEAIDIFYTENYDWFDLINVKSVSREDPTASVYEIIYDVK